MATAASGEVSLDERLGAGVHIQRLRVRDCLGRVVVQLVVEGPAPASRGLDSGPRPELGSPWSGLEADVPGPSSRGELGWLRAAGHASRRPPPGHAIETQPLAAESVFELLALAAQTGLTVAIRAGSAPALHWAGRLSRVAAAAPFATAGGADAQLTWCEDRSAALLVKRPTRCGLLHSLLLLDPRNAPVLSIEDDGPPDRPERCQWHQLIAAIAD